MEIGESHACWVLRSVLIQILDASPLDLTHRLKMANCSMEDPKFTQVVVVPVVAGTIQ